MTVSAVRPWRNALRRERCLPSGVVGPVLLSALRRLASICLRELIDDQQVKLGSFRHGKRDAVRFGLTLCPGPLPICPWWSSVFGRDLRNIFIALDVCRRRFWARLLP